MTQLIRLADYVARRLAESGVTQVFMMTGGGAMHLNDALGFEPRFSVWCHHHEQAAAIAAEGFARVSGRPAVVNVTTGPGGINALTGVFGAYTDSIPMIIVSGQVRRDTVVGLTSSRGLRQLGDQEVDIIRMAQGITKYAVLVDDPATIRFHLEKALYLATSGRAGPVWLDIPIDVQGTRIDPDTLAGFDSESDIDARGEEDVQASASQLENICREVADRLISSQRPVILVGTGVRLSGAQVEFERIIGKLGLPVTTAWTAVDQIESSNPLFCGRPGTIGDRGGNFAVQNADLLLVLGSRLPIRQVSYNWSSFAREAFKIVLDIDPAELAKPMVKPDLPICADARSFIIALEREIDRRGVNPTRHAGWLAWCRERHHRYPIVQERQRTPRVDGLINPYGFVSALYEELNARDILVCGNATASVVGFQTATIKAGQRVFANAGCAAMGYDLPAGLGAAAAANGGRVVVLAGDGSLQLNVQELQTLALHAPNIKLFVLSNNGYLSMRMSQGNFFKRFIGESPASGVSFPDVLRLADAYGLPNARLEGPDFQSQLRLLLAVDGPLVVDVRLDPDQVFEPRSSSRQLPDGRIVSAPLEDMFPFLPPDEMAENMLVVPQQA